MLRPHRLAVMAASIGLFGLVAGFGVTRTFDDASADDQRAQLTEADIPLLGGNAVQQAALADLSASQEERRVAADSAVACIRAAGITVSDAGWTGERYTYTAGPFPTRDELDAAKPTLNECYAAHMRGLDVVAASAQ